MIEEQSNNQNRPRRPRYSRPARRPTEGSSATPQTDASGEQRKQTNQNDRYLRPSLSQHGARPYTPRDRSTAPRRPKPQDESQPVFQTTPRVTPGRNPRLNDNRPVVRRPAPASRPATPGTSGPAPRSSSSSPRFNRRRFSTPTVNPDLSHVVPAVTAPAVTVIGSGSKQLRIIPLGGAGEVGSKNMTVFEYGQDIVVVDCGIAFADRDLPGVDSLIPDVRYLEERKARIRGLVFTHGHEDHIGGVPYIWPKLQCPMYATPLAGGLIQHKLDEAGVTNAAITVVQAGDKIHFGQISIEMVRLTHSIPDVLGLAIRCPAGLFFYATDWRLEHTPALGKPADWTRIAQLAGEGITALFSDSTNVDRPGYSPTERTIGEAFDRIFQETKGRIIIAQFSSNINRIQMVINSAKKFGRKMAISGRSMETYITIAMNLGYLSIPEGMLIDLRKINTVDPNKLIILSTGSQGEEFSSLVRISEGEHRHVKLDTSDTVLLSASAIPGNEVSVSKLIDRLYREGANVIHNKTVADVHVSGHPSRDELKMMIALAQPKYFIPIHGDYHQMVEHGKVAVEMGVDEANVILMENGQVVEFDDKGGRMTEEKIQLDDIMIDGLGIGDVGPIVIRDRQVMGNEGMVTILMVVNQKTGELLASPDIISRGFIYVREAEGLMNQLREEIKRSYSESFKRYGPNWEDSKAAMRDEIGKFLADRTGRSPMVIPVITAL